MTMKTFALKVTACAENYANPFPSALPINILIDRLFHFICMRKLPRTSTLNFRLYAVHYKICLLCQSDMHFSLVRTTIEFTAESRCHCPDRGFVQSSTCGSAETRGKGCELSNSQQGEQ